MKIISNTIKKTMINESIDKAYKIYNTMEIFPCGNYLTFDECFTINENDIMFWYNVDTGYGITTKVTVHKMSN